MSFASESSVISVVCTGGRLSGYKMKVTRGKRMKQLRYSYSREHTYKFVTFIFLGDITFSLFHNLGNPYPTSQEISKISQNALPSPKTHKRDHQILILLKYKDKNSYK